LLEIGIYTWDSAVVTSARISLEAKMKYQFKLKVNSEAHTCGISDYPAPETLSHHDLSLILNKLYLLLENLPIQLPSKPVNGPDASRYTKHLTTGR
jgi:hypothetical protein